MLRFCQEARGRFALDWALFSGTCVQSLHNTVYRWTNVRWKGSTGFSRLLFTAKDIYLWNQPWLCNEQVFILYFQAGPEFFYACYFPENEKFTRAVAGIVNYFRQNGYPVVMDVMSSNEMVDLGPTRWAEQQIKKAHKILVFLSPGILRLCGAADEDKQSLHQVTWCGLAS